MEFIKKNYEKVILSVVLVGLIGVLVGMWFVIIADKQKMADTATKIVSSGKPLPPLDTSRQDAAIARIKNPPVLDFSETNKLFNPVQWERDASGKLIKLSTGHEIGPGAAVVTKITPLYFIVRLESVETNLTTPHYKISVEHQGSPYPAMRHAIPHYIGTNETVKGVFKLVSVKGPADDPTALVLQLPSGENITVKKDKPFQSIEGYSADIKYDVGGEHVNGTGLRVGDQLNFAGDQYNIIDINQNEVRLLAQSNQKKYVLPYRP
jgi:hypothetical protein